MSLDYTGEKQAVSSGRTVSNREGNETALSGRRTFGWGKYKFLRSESSPVQISAWHSAWLPYPGSSKCFLHNIKVCALKRLLILAIVERFDANVDCWEAVASMDAILEKSRDWYQGGNPCCSLADPAASVGHLVTSARALLWMLANPVVQSECLVCWPVCSDWLICGPAWNWPTHYKTNASAWNSWNLWYRDLSYPDSTSSATKSSYKLFEAFSKIIIQSHHKELNNNHI